MNREKESDDNIPNLIKPIIAWFSEGAGSQSGVDKQQVLLVVTSSGKNLNQVTSALAQVESTLPYK